MSIKWRRVLWLFVIVSVSMFPGTVSRTDEGDLAIADVCASGAYVRLARQIRQDVLQVDNSPHDPVAVVCSVGRSPYDLADAIREWIAWQPELGVVRGPAGTLSAGAGGDWDRAALLRAVLEAGGYPVRFVVAPRDEKGREEVVEQFLAADASGLIPESEPGGYADETSNTELLRRYGVPVRDRTILTANASARWRRLLDEAYDAGERHADFIVHRLAEPPIGPAAGFDFPAWMRSLKRAAAEAVAVEVNTPDGWILLELGPDAKQVDWTEARRVSDIPPKRIATLTLRMEMTLAAEEGEDAEQVEIFEYTEELGDLFRKPMRLEVVPVGGEGAGARPGEWKAEEWYEYVKGFDRFQVVLLVGAEGYTSQVFDTTGQLHEVGGDGRIAVAGQIGRGIQDAFGGLFGPPREEAEDAATGLKTITLALDIDRPGIPVVRQRRLLYGPLREGVSPVFHADIVAAGGPIGPASMLWMTLDAITANAGVWAEVLAAADPSGYPDDAPVRMPRMLYEWQIARLALAGRQKVQNPDLTILPGPAVSMWTTQIRCDGEARQVLARTSLDVVWDALHLGPRESLHSQTAARSNVSLGVASTAFEALLLRELVPPVTIHTALAEAELFYPYDAPHDSPAPLAEWGIEHNEAGRTVLFAGGVAPNSWWSIDPATCAAIGRGDGGEGQALSEYSKIQKQTIKNLKCFLQALGSGLESGARGEAEAAAGFAFCLTGTEGAGGKLGAGKAISKKMGATHLGSIFGTANQALSAMNRADRAVRAARGE